MPFELAVFIASLVLIGTAAFGAAGLERVRRARREAELASEARSRGWRFEADDDGVFRVHRWRGTTDGIAWTAEHRRRRYRKKGRHARTHRFVWWADTLRGPAAPVLFVGVRPGTEAPIFTVARGHSLLARLAQKAAGVAFDQAVDVYFGSDAGVQVDAAGLERVEAANLPGYIVMAADRSDTTRLLVAGWRDAVAEEIRNPASAISDADRPWILLLPRRVSLARTSPIDGTATVERFTRAGAALVRRT